METSQAGPGNLEVTVNGGRVATSAQAQGPHTYAISFTPRQATTHTVDLRFNGRDVPGIRRKKITILLDFSTLNRILKTLLHINKLCSKSVNKQDQ